MNMVNLKTFEGYIDEKINALKKIKKFIDFMEKYKLTYFVIGNTDNDENYQFEYIENDKESYTVEYMDYTGESDSEYKRDLINLPNEVINALYQACEDRFDIEYHLEILAGDMDHFIEILKIHKKPIEFTEWIFGMILENGEQERGNSFKFQDILFSTHPEAYKPFIDECFSSLKRSIEHDFEPLKVNPKILKKYKKLLGEYYHQKEVEHSAEKYNL